MIIYCPQTGKPCGSTGCTEFRKTCQSIQQTMPQVPTGITVIENKFLPEKTMVVSSDLYQTMKNFSKLFGN